ncbi:TfoX/Sxy family protein [Yoonia maritima]|uniref:TfoX/Sxy family protein n=1 Tax=Yoonia maritima TaxID=1435347 RepID=UPI00373530DF
MAYDEGHAELLRQELVDELGLTEKKMFGGLCFLIHGNMVCGVHNGGGMARVGKSLEPKALEIEGIQPFLLPAEKWAVWLMLPKRSWMTIHVVAKSLDLRSNMRAASHRSHSQASQTQIERPEARLTRNIRPCQTPLSSHKST